MRAWALSAAAVASGTAALTYETLWTRSFSIILGSTAYAASATFAGFLIGLATGAWAVRRFADRAKNPILAYAGVEVAIAILGPATGFALHAARTPLTSLLGPAANASPIVMAVVVALVVLPATFAMGATFPLLLASGARLISDMDRVVPRLYGLNTLGAAAGALATGFYLLGNLGVAGTLLTAAALNLIAAALCAPLLAEEDQLPGEAAQPASKAAHTEGKTKTGARAKRRAQRAAENDKGKDDDHGNDDAIEESSLLIVALTSGLLTLGLEVVWLRLASFFVGNRTFAFSLTLACVLVLLALGSALAGVLARRGLCRTGMGFGLLVLSGALSSVLSVRFAVAWIEAQSRVEATFPSLERAIIVYRALEAAALMAPCFVILGALFPLSLVRSRRAKRGVGGAAGLFYLVNTVGAVVGSLAVGLYGFETIGALRCVAFLCVGACWVALGLLLRAYAKKAGTHKIAAIVAALGSAVLIPFVVPDELPLHVEEGDEVVARSEDAYGVFAIVRTPDGTSRVTNNRTELVFRLGHMQTSYVQQMQGHLGMFYKPDARVAAVLGSGYGITAGALSTYPSLTRIDAVEILPAMVDNADLFEPSNLAYHRRANVNVVVDDARHFLSQQKERYDIISINVSDPHLAGGSSLFHVDFYEEAKEKLAADGVLLQHVFGTDADLVLRSLLRSFEHIRLFSAYGNGFNVVAANWDLSTADGAAADALLQASSVRAALASIGIAPPLRPSGLMEAAILLDELEEDMPPGTSVATDAIPRIELSLRGNARALLFSNE